MRRTRDRGACGESEASPRRRRGRLANAKAPTEGGAGFEGSCAHVRFRAGGAIQGFSAGSFNIREWVGDE